MDLISREEAINSVYDGTSYDVLTEECKRHIEEVPSAFEGMTNRDVLKALFPIDENQGIRYIKVYLDHEPIESFELSTTQKWLDSPYKGVNE